MRIQITRKYDRRTEKEKASRSWVKHVYGSNALCVLSILPCVPRPCVVILARSKRSTGPRPTLRQFRNARWKQIRDKGKYTSVVVNYAQSQPAGGERPPMIVQNEFFSQKFTEKLKKLYSPPLASERFSSPFSLVNTSE